MPKEAQKKTKNASSNDSKVKIVKKQEKVITKKTEKQVKPAAEPKETKLVEKKIKVKRVLRKIEDFNAFHKERQEREVSIQKDISSVLKIDKAMLLKAVNALKTYKKNRTESKGVQLLDKEDDFVYIEFTVNKLPESFSIRPYQIKLETPIYSEDYFSKHCIFVKDPQREYKDKIQDLEIPLIGKVIGYKKLVSDFRRYEERRNLVKEYDLFFCDYKIYDLIRKPTGKFFYDRKKIPFPIDCESNPAYSNCKDYAEYLNSLSNFTYFIQGNGPNYALKVARSSMESSLIVQNILAAVPQLAAYLIDS